MSINTGLGYACSLTDAIVKQTEIQQICKGSVTRTGYGVTDVLVSGACHLPVFHLLLQGWQVRGGLEVCTVTATCIGAYRGQHFVCPRYGDFICTKADYRLLACCS